MNNIADSLSFVLETVSCYECYFYYHYHGDCFCFIVVLNYYFIMNSKTLLPSRIMNFII